MHFMRNYKGTTLRATQHRALNPPDTHPLFRSTERCNNGQRHAHWTNHKTHGQMFPTGFHVPRFPVQWPSHNAQMHLGSGVAGKRGIGEAGAKSRGYFTTASTVQWLGNRINAAAAHAALAATTDAPGEKRGNPIRNP
uniref:HDC05448 n=1 Tax=Drosophila melanogaster TaxID=7227 RepID=Q6IGS6_DROME|nr:TPA_inf: HDC05448 [Drosophila melanogaster]